MSAYFILTLKNWHGYDDYTGGLKYFFKEKKNIELILHLESFNYKEDDMRLCISSPLIKKELSKVCILNLTKEPIKISEHITYLGEIPIENDIKLAKQLSMVKRLRILLKKIQQ